MNRPRIGITLDSEPPGGYSQLPWYALRENYCDAIADAGGLPRPLPHNPELVADYLAEIDGLLITGGAFDVDPALFGENQRHASVTTKQRRTACEWALTQGALDHDLAILGICGGQQLLHVVLGGKLIQHIPDTIPDALAHEQPNPRTEPGHTVSIVAGTLLHGIVGMDEMPVNSAHHQAALDFPAGVVINATARDGVIEGIEVPARRFVVGVQWHPEYHISPGDGRLFDAFIAAARETGS